jgi:nucleoside-diphosphate-sugar epimerase
MILITGGTGMAGSFIVQELQRRGYEVRVLARAESVEIAQKLEAEVAIGDLADADSLRRAAQGVNGIIHAASTLSKDPEVDMAAMQVLLEAWDEGPFVFISSVDVYGYPKWVAVTEDHPLDESYSDYGRAKIRSENMLTSLARARGRHDFSILRPPHIWGPHPRCAERLITPNIREGKPIVLPGATEEEWSRYGDSWVDARELAWATAECLRQPLGEAANAISGHFSWHEVYSELIRLTGSKSQIVHKDLDAIAAEELPRKNFYAQTWRYSGERLEQRLGFRPSRRWQDTLAEIVALGSR